MVVVLPTPVGPTRATSRRAPASTRIGPETRISLFDDASHAGLQQRRIEQVVGGRLAADPFDQLAGQVLAELGIDQVGVQMEQLFGQIVRAALRCGGRAPRPSIATRESWPLQSRA